MKSVGGSLIPIALLQHRIQHLLMPFTQNLTNVFQCKSVQYDCIKYSIGYCMVTGHDGNHYEFCKIQQCFLINGIVLVLCKKLHTVGYRRHLNAHVVRETDQYELIDLRMVTQPTTLGIYKLENSDQAVIMKSHLLF